MTSRKKKASDDSTFESSIDSLVGLLEKLENQELSLEDSLAAFEQGIALSRKAQQTLSEAEQKVRLLQEENGDPLEGAFESDGEHG